MAPSKLSDSDKSEIVELYRQPEQTTSTLAEQYGVSNSTISRILKMSMSPDEYSDLVSQKRMSGSGGTSRGTRKKKSTKAAVVEATPAVPEFEPADNQPLADGSIAADAEKVAPPKLKSKSKEEAPADKSSRRKRKRSRTASKDESDEQLPLLTTDTESVEETEETETRKPAKPSSRPKPILAKKSQEDEEEEDDDDEDDLVGLDETLGDDFGDDDDDLIEEEDDDDDDDELPEPRLSAEAALSIMPLDEAVLPKPCYLVVDTRAELITRPLVEFSDLGKIPSSEERERTLPVFDNHRVARRFSRNKQRVIKVPDGSLITRTSPYLTAKGITRLLVDGQVFDLVGVE